MGIRAATPWEMQATRLPLQLRPEKCGESFSIGREVGSRPYRRAQTRNCQVPGGSSGSAQRFLVRSALVQWRLCSMLQRLLLYPLPLSLRWIISYAERLVDQSDG